MATTNEITYSSQYRGDVALGGGTLGSFQLDTKPLEDLGRYTMLYNKAEYEAKQKQMEDMAKEVSELTKYDLSSAIPKDREELQKEYAGIMDYIRTDRSVMNYQKNPKGYVEYQKKKNDLLNKIKSGTVRSTLYATREEEASKANTPELRALLKKKLDEEAATTDIHQPLRHTANYDIAPVAIPKAPMKEFDVTDIGVNFNIDRNFKMPDPAAVKSLAASAVLGLDKLNEAQNSTDPALREEYEMQVASGKLEPLLSAQNFNQAVQPLLQDPKYKNPDGSTNWDAIAKNTKGLLHDNIQQVLAYNKKVGEISGYIRAGAFKDDFGSNNVGFSRVGSLKEETYAPINLEDGLDATELMTMRILAGSESETIKTDTKYTGAGTASNREQETGRHNRAMENIDRSKVALDREEFGQKKKEWASTQTGGADQKNGAMTKANRIYDSLMKLADKNGVISPDNLRKLNSEQLKYLGSLKTTPEGTDYETLSLGDPKKDKFAIQLENGDIRVMADAVPYTDEQGRQRYRGNLDATKSTNIYNVATNVLNEQLKTAGSKELNAYWGIDVTGGNTQFSDKTTTTRTGTSNEEKTEQVQPEPKKEILRSQLAKKAELAGYTVKEYEAMLKKLGVTIK